MSTEAATLRRLAGREKDELKARRLRAAALVVEGQSISAAARQVPMDRARLSHWMARYREHGVAGLDDRRPAKAALPAGQVEILEIWARAGHDPARVARVARDEFSIEIEPAAIREILRERCGLVWRGRRWTEARVAFGSEDNRRLIERGAAAPLRK